MTQVANVTPVTAIKAGFLSVVANAALFATQPEYARAMLAGIAVDVKNGSFSYVSRADRYFDPQNGKVANRAGKQYNGGRAIRAAITEEIAVRWPSQVASVKDGAVHNIAKGVGVFQKVVKDVQIAELAAGSTPEQTEMHNALKSVVAYWNANKARGSVGTAPAAAQETAQTEQPQTEKQELKTEKPKADAKSKGKGAGVTA